MYPYREVAVGRLLGLILCISFGIVRIELYPYVYHKVYRVDLEALTKLFFVAVRILLGRLLVYVLLPGLFKGGAQLAGLAGFAAGTPLAGWINSSLASAVQKAKRTRFWMERCNDGLRVYKKFSPYFYHRECRLRKFHPWIVVRPLPKLPSFEDPRYYPGNGGGMGIVLVVVTVIYWIFFH